MRAAFLTHKGEGRWARRWEPGERERKAALRTSGAGCLGGGHCSGRPAARAASVGIEPPSGALVPRFSQCVAAAVVRTHHTQLFGYLSWCARGFFEGIGNYECESHSGIRFCLLFREGEKKRFNVARCAVPFSRRRLSSLDLRFSGKYRIFY